MSEPRGKFVVITGPSAAGKSMLVDALLKKISSSTRIVTLTTRSPRPQEKHGIDYYFVSRKEFEQRIERGDFFEHAEVYGNLYGSSREILEKLLKTFQYVFAVIDVQGAKTLKKKLPEALIVFIRPGSLNDLKARMSSRMQIPTKELAKRISNAEHELTLASSFDAVIDNIDGEFEQTVEKTLNIL